VSAPALSAVRAPAAPPWAWLAAAGLIAAALAVQLRFGMMADVAWLAHCDELWLSGKIPYRDFIEINPPASLLLYIAPVAAARGLGIASETAISIFGFAAAAASMALSARILNGRAPASVALAALAALVVLPGETFCERDHLAAVFGLPLLACAWARAERAPPSWLQALAAGVGAGAMAAIKPPYALVGVLLALYLVARLGWRAAVRAPEYYAAAAFGLAYVACVGPFFPDYVARVMPVGVAIYMPAREGLLALAASPGAMLFLSIAAAAALTARALTPGMAVAGLAAAGAAVGYVLQGKGWIYQAVPAAMFATIAGGFAWASRSEAEDAGASHPWALAAGGVVAALVAPGLHNLGAGWVLGIAAAQAVEFARTRDLRLEPRRLAPLGLAAAIGAACGVCTIERPPTPELEVALARLGPGVKLASLSEDMGLSFPLARRIGAQWVLKRHSLFVTSDVRRVVARRPDAAARLAPFASAERAEVLADIAANKPDAILVGPTGTALHAELWKDARVTAALADYERVAEERRPGYTAELWLRKPPGAAGGKPGFEAAGLRGAAGSASTFSTP
jgi:hypothetical protein